MRSFPILLLLLAGLTACGDSVGGVGSQPGSFSGASATQGFDDLGLLGRIMVAASKAEYVGRREVSFFTHDAYGAVDELTYVEQVTSDGNGLFDVVLEDLLAPKLAPDRVEIFKLIQKGREEFFYNHRDFHVRDQELFLANYSIELQDGVQELLGRKCLLLHIQRRGSDTARYEVHVDRETGLVLLQREFDSKGLLVSEVEFTELRVGVVSPDVRARVRARKDISWRPALPHDGLTDLNVHTPSVPPTGFQLLDQRIVTDPLGDQWYELIYGDGVEQVFVLYALDPPPPTKVLPEDEVRLFRHGRWTVAEGLLRGERVIILGKAASDDLILMLESCL